MGTSTSSNGPKGGVSLIPQWLDQVSGEIENGGHRQGGGAKKQLDLAPDRRFANVRRALNQYTKTGEKEYVGKALGSYSKKGWGGIKKSN